MASKTAGQMKSRQWTALGVVLGLIGATAALLAHVGASQRLGQPGLKLVAAPTFTTNGVVVRTESVSLPTEVLEYNSEPEEVSPLEIGWLPKDTLFGRRRYRGKDGFEVLASVVLMGTDRTSIHKPQFCLDGQGWRIAKTETVTIPIPRPHPYELRVMKLTAAKQAVDKQGAPRMVSGIYVYWFVADNLLTPHHGERMWWMARDLIRTGVLQRWAYVSYFTACWPGQEEAAFKRVQELIAASVPEFQLATGPVSKSQATAAVLPQAGPSQAN
jgi:hypothetical protein